MTTPFTYKGRKLEIYRENDSVPLSPNVKWLVSFEGALHHFRRVGIMVRHNDTECTVIWCDQHEPKD
jgi:hypothetical protein